MKICTTKLYIIDVPDILISVDSIKFEKFELEAYSVYISRHFSLITVFNENDIRLRSRASYNFDDFRKVTIENNVIWLSEPKSGKTEKSYAIVAKTIISKNITNKMHKLTMVLEK